MGSSGEDCQSRVDVPFDSASESKPTWDNWDLLAWKC